MKILLSITSFFVLSFMAGYLLQLKLRPPDDEVIWDDIRNQQVKNQLDDLRIQISPYYTEKVQVAKNMTFYALLRARGISKEDVFDMLKMAKPFFDLAKMPLGSEIEIVKRSKGHEVVLIRLFLFEDEVLIFRKNDNEWKISKQKQEWDIVKRLYRGSVDNSLWESLMAEGLDEKAISEFMKIFAWQIDFDRQTKSGDFWKILIEEKHRDGKFVGWRNIVYAEYKKGEADPLQGIRFPENTKDAHYYSLEGDNLAGLFLKSPVEFTRISSKFQRKRYHPILKIERPHYGIDYAAARGTPVYSIGDGLVKRFGYSRGSGNFVILQHNKTYQSAYKHLQGFAKGLKLKQLIKQGQLIGYVGSTGLATGPHLHFEFLENDKHIDPLSTSFPRAGSVPFSDQEDFKKVVFKSQNEINKISQNISKKEKETVE